MKKIILILTASLFLGCGGRQSAVQKSKKVQETSSEVQGIKKVKTDSSGTKKVQEQEQTSTKTNTNSWKYTAPAAVDFPCLNGVGMLSPFYIKTPAGDSIDVSRLPAGSSLESLSESSEKATNYQRTVNEQAQIIKDLEAKLNKKEKAKTIEIEKIKEVERQSIQWLLVGGALLLGTFLPSIFKFLWSIIKSRFKF